MLKKEVCRKCLAREYGLQGEEKTGNIGCYPSLNNNDEQSFFDKFEEEWNSEKVWCLGCDDIEWHQHPLSSEGSFCQFVYTNGNIPGFCRFKGEQLGSQEKWDKEVRRQTDMDTRYADGGDIKD